MPLTPEERLTAPSCAPQEKEEQEKPFDIYHYAEHILNRFTQKDKAVLDFPHVVVGDQYSDSPKIHTARSFLALLQLCNNGNVELQHQSGLVSEKAPLTVRLKKRGAAPVTAKRKAPISDVSNTQPSFDAQPASSPQQPSAVPPPPPTKRRRGMA